MEKAGYHRSTLCPKPIYKTKTEDTKTPETTAVNDSREERGSHSGGHVVRGVESSVARASVDGTAVGDVAVEDAGD